MSRLIKESEKEYIQLLQDDIQGEIDAIEMYDEHIEKISTPEIKDKLIHIRNEEKHHLDELQELIQKYQ